MTRTFGRMEILHLIDDEREAGCKTLSQVKTVVLAPESSNILKKLMMLAAMLALVVPMMAAAPAMARAHHNGDLDGVNVGVFDEEDEGFFDFFGLER